MRVVLSAVFFAFVLVGGFYFYNKYPAVVQYRDCYNQGYSIINEEHIIARRAHVSDAVICVERKNTLLDALGCFQLVDKEVPSASEQDVLKTIARNMARGTKSMEDLVEDHNKRCTYNAATIEYDPRVEKWF